MYRLTYDPASGAAALAWLSGPKAPEVGSVSRVWVWICMCECVYVFIYVCVWHVYVCVGWVGVHLYSTLAAAAAATLAWLSGPKVEVRSYYYI